MKKSTHKILFMFCFVFFLILNLFFTIAPVDLSTVIGMIVRTLIGSCVVYIIIVFIVHIIAYIAHINRNNN